MDATRCEICCSSHPVRATQLFAPSAERLNYGPSSCPSDRGSVTDSLTQPAFPLLVRTLCDLAPVGKDIEILFCWKKRRKVSAATALQGFRASLLRPLSLSSSLMLLSPMPLVRAVASRCMRRLLFPIIDNRHHRRCSGCTILRTALMMPRRTDASSRCSRSISTRRLSMMTGPGSGNGISEKG